MPSHYRKKYLAEYWALDMPPKKTKKNIESSNRWAAKRFIQSQLEEYENMKDEDELKELAQKAEMQMAHDCYMAETKAAREGKPYNCTCEDPFKWTKKQLYDYFGYDYEKKQ